MYNYLKAFAESQDWGFEYSRADYQNLYDDIEKNKIYLFVDPISTDSQFSDTGNETITYSGKMMLLMSSDVDEQYNDKYNSYIKPLFDNSLQAFKDDIACSIMQVNSLKTTEIVNLFDQNMDGLMINYSITLLD